MMVSFQNQTFCTDTLPTDGTAPSHTLQIINYSFVYTPSVTDNIPLTGEGDTTGTQPRRNAGDTSRDGGN
jgi:hypothetical protein